MPTGILRTFFANSLPCPASAPSSSFLPVSSSPPFLPKPRTSLTAPPGRISSLTRSTPAASTRRTSRRYRQPSSGLLSDDRNQAQLPRCRAERPGRHPARLRIRHGRHFLSQPQRPGRCASRSYRRSRGFLSARFFASEYEVQRRLPHDQSQPCSQEQFQYSGAPRLLRSPDLQGSRRNREGRDSGSGFLPGRIERFAHQSANPVFQEGRNGRPPLRSRPRGFENRSLPQNRWPQQQRADSGNRHL